jgi:iron complex transport system ATP-binding protein
VVAAHGVTYSVDGATLLHDVTVELHPGMLVALLGPNGAGKSTLLRVLSGDLEPTAGTLLLDGRPLTGHTLRDLAVRRAVLPQASHLTFPFSAYEVVLLGRHPHLARRRETVDDHTIAEGSMRRTETTRFRDRSYPTLSGGEQARVGLARVLAQDTSIVLLDEPTAHLDPRHQHHVLATARELTHSGTAVLAVLHDLNLAATHADAVVVLADGRVCASGTPWDALTEETLEDVFGLPFRRITHPERDVPLLIPVPAAVAPVLDRAPRR